MTDRKCSSCTACCEGWLTTKVSGVIIEPGTPCVNCTKQGCKIYERRPQNPCVSFKCVWLREPDKLPEHMKPSKCGAIVTLSKWGGKQVITATPVGQKIPIDTLEWLMAFAREHSLPLMFSEHVFEDGKYLRLIKKCYGPQSFTRKEDTGIRPEDIMRF